MTLRDAKKNTPGWFINYGERLQEGNTIIYISKIRSIKDAKDLEWLIGKIEFAISMAKFKAGVRFVDMSEVYAPGEGIVASTDDKSFQSYKPTKEDRRTMVVRTFQKFIKE